MTGCPPESANNDLPDDCDMLAPAPAKRITTDVVTRQDAAPATTRMRDCLNYDRAFMSEGIHNRRCLQCRTESAGMVA